MAIAVVNPNSTTPAVPVVQGNRRHETVRVNFDNSYVTGGYVITPATAGLQQIEFVLCNPSNLARPVTPVLSAAGVWTLKVFSAISTEVAAAVDLSADFVLVEVIGK